ncbi:MAG: hypothetical protein U0R26_08370 [Solirubrobacterales bacterium]
MLSHTIVILPQPRSDLYVLGATGWETLLAEGDGDEPSFERVPFDHPLWVLYSSGTTGLPKQGSSRARAGSCSST